MSIAMSSAISGLSALQQMLDVVGGNLSNSSTPGYKSQNITFKELMTQNMKGATGPNGQLGSSNPQDKGTGVTTGSISQNFAQGSFAVTGRTSDLAINGDGFFAIRDFKGGLAYTRAGNFTLDRNGYLVNPDGLKLQGWNAVDGAVNPLGVVEGLQIPMGTASMARATTAANFEGNLDADAATYSASTQTGGMYTTDAIFYDSLGSPHSVTMKYTRNVTPANQGGNWTWTATVDGNASGTGTIAFDSYGQFDPANSTINPTIAFTPTTGAAAVSVAVDFSGISQLSGVNSVLSRSQNGFPPGVLQSYSIGSDGMITGTYSNGLNDTLGQIALATCANNEGLNRGEGGLYTTTASSGEMLLTAAQGNAFTSGALEDSNVDVGLAFTQMIVAQRAFEANARMVSTMDQVLSALTHLRG